MKVLILACLVALALARETVDSLSGDEESITHIKKLEKAKCEEQQREDERQDKIHTFFQPQPPVPPYAEPIPYPVLPQSILPLVQPVVVVHFLQPEIMELSEDKETIFPKHKVMPSPQARLMSLFDRQTRNLSGFENSHLLMPLLQPFMHQPLPQTPVLPPLSLMSLYQSKALPVPQQVVPSPQRGMPIHTLLQYREHLLDPIQESYSMSQPLASVYNPVSEHAKDSKQYFCLPLTLQATLDKLDNMAQVRDQLAQQPELIAQPSVILDLSKNYQLFKSLDK
ncbi:beta-casein [Orycteropus afer afer]|uniref:Beta-casein n=1 Tax=Orycteropus afer afer TaxID=1230840 RepID=A0AC54Z2V9_ORYAF|nr:beta-casein [Orycteropus afer afer]